MKSLIAAIFILTVCAPTYSDVLTFNCPSQMTQKEFKDTYVPESENFVGVGECKPDDTSPIAYINVTLDLENNYAEIGEDRCIEAYVSAFQSWRQRATLETLPSVYRLITSNPLPSSNGFFAYDLTRTENSQVTMLRQGWVFDCEMTREQQVQPAF